METRDNLWRNIEHCRRLLRTETDESKRRTIKQMLDELEGELAESGASEDRE